VDVHGKRQIHKHITPGLGGLAIFLGAAIGMFYLQTEHVNLMAISLGVCYLILSGILDDKYNIHPIVKLLDQLSALVLLLSSVLVIEKLTVPFIGMVDLGWWGVAITILWVVGITNAINLIDGLDGLATGVSTIGLLSMFVMSLIDLQLFAAY